MNAKNTQPSIDTNNAGVPPAPPEAHHRAGWVEIPKSELKKHYLSGRVYISFAALKALSLAGFSLSDLLDRLSGWSDPVLVGQTIILMEGIQAYFGCDAHRLDDGEFYMDIDVISDVSLPFCPRISLFPLGQVLATPAALDLLAEHGLNATDFIERHRLGDWSELPAEDAQMNVDSIKLGGRIFSAYYLTDDHRRSAPRVWVITEADRSVTTLFLPEEY
ncbi:hypothetical protein [Chitinimonas sp. BJB300]|uniref:hypothetical protein n=1 Tax=Chitinimonas sp. BJB300 TaxID=1559339 RepID=UPI0026B46145|nr:hypothetical protein [Chitinimonas sp. BJB300]